MSRHQGFETACSTCGNCGGRRQAKAESKPLPRCFGGSAACPNSISCYPGCYFIKHGFAESLCVCSPRLQQQRAPKAQNSLVQFPVFPETQGAAGWTGVCLAMRRRMRNIRRILHSWAYVTRLCSPSQRNDSTAINKGAMLGVYGYQGQRRPDSAISMQKSND